jgi:hypothetical protein
MMSQESAQALLDAYRKAKTAGHKRVSFTVTQDKNHKGAEIHTAFGVGRVEGVNAYLKDERVLFDVTVSLPVGRAIKALEWAIKKGGARG